MFITSDYSGYNRHGEQSAAGLFLMVFSGDDKFPMPGDASRNLPRLRACVRHAHMTQLGHFMMARVRVGKHRITLSGSYGSDGLTLDAPEGVWEKLVPVPDELAVQFWNGGGHNSSGSEGPAMRKWAQDNLAALRKAGK